MSQAYTGVAFFARYNRVRVYIFILQDGTHRWQHQFGKNVLALKWTHFTITFEKGVGICAYIDGKLDKCGGTSTVKSASHFPRCARLGYESLNDNTSDVYMDDLAIWKSTLTAEEVKEIYDLSKI